VKQAAVDCPRTEAVNVDAFRHDNGAILMPSKRPIGCRRLVEQQHPHLPDAGLFGRQITDRIRDVLQSART
jgi:hypothetical protein